MEKLSEEFLLIAGNIIQVEDDMLKFDAIFEVHRLMVHQDIFLWFLQRLHEFEHPYTRGIAIGKIADIIHTSWNNISPELYDQISEEFFNSIFTDPNYDRPDLRLKIYQIEADIIHQFYPERWPTFFSEIVQVPKPRLYGFLAQFNISMYSNASIMFRDNSKLQQSMLTDGSQLLLLQTVLNDTANNEPGAATAISNLVEWIDQSIIYNLGVIQTFFNLLDEEDTCEEAILCILNFIKREHPVDQLSDFIEETGIAERLLTIVQQPVSVSVSKNIAEIVEHFASLDLGEPFYEIGKILFMSENVEVNGKATEYIRAYAAEHEESIEEIAELSLTKILQVIENPTAEQDILIKKPLSILTSLAAAGASLSDNLLSIAKEVDYEENMAGCAAIIAALMLFFQDSKDIDSLISVVNTFEHLLEIPPPYNFSHLSAISNYATLSKPLLNKPECTDFAISLFEQCVRVASNYDLALGNENIENIFQAINLIAKYHTENVLQLDEIAQILNCFIESKDRILLQTANFIISALDESERAEKYEECLNYFLECIQEDAENSNKNCFSPIFEFIGEMNLSDCDALIPEVTEFFEQTNEIIAADRSAYALYVRSSVKILGTDAFRFFWDSIKSIEWEAFTAIAEASLTIDDQEEILIITNVLLEKIRTVPLSQQKNRPRNNESLMAEEMYIACVRFFMRSGVFPLLDNNGQHSVIRAINDVISTLMPSYELMTEIIVFMDTIITPENLELTLVHSNLLTLMLSPRKKPSADREACKALTEVYIDFSHKQAMMNPAVFVNSADRAYTGQLPTTMRMDYFVTVATEDPVEYEQKKAQLIELILASYDLGEE